MPNEPQAPTPNAKTTRMRSPAYPLFGLGEAIKKARAMWDVQRKSDAHLDSVLATLGYSGRNGASLRAIGALNHYGLTEESGSGDNRRLRLSELAQDIIHLPEDDSRRAEAMKVAALAPAIHALLWERYGHQLPNEVALKAFLVREKGYNESAALDVIKNYQDTFSVANLGRVADTKLHDVQPPNQLRKDPPSSGGAATLPGVQANPSPPPGNESRPMTQELPILVGDGLIAKIPFPMTADDFDLLIGTLNLWKKRIVKVVTEPKATPIEPKLGAKQFPQDAIWKNNDHDKPVTIVGEMGEHNGEKYYQTAEGTGVPVSELTFA